MLEDAEEEIDKYESDSLIGMCSVQLKKIFKAYNKPKKERTFKPGDKINVLRWGMNNPITLVVDTFDNKILYLDDYEVVRVQGKKILGGCNDPQAITKEEIESAVGKFEAVDE